MPDRRWTGPWRRHGRRSWLRPPPRGRAPCSIAPPVRRSPIGWPGRQRRIAGRPDRLHSAPLRDHSGAPHALAPSLARLLLGSHGRRNSARANDREKGTLNGVIHPQPAKRDATRLAIVHPAAGATVARDMMLRSRVAEGQFTPASATAEQARQQSVAVLGRTMVTAGGCIAADHLAGRFGLVPADITLIGVRHQRQPVAAWFVAGPFL